MKSNLLAIALLLICLALGAVVWMQNQHHAVQAVNEGKLTNDYSKLEDKYTEQKLVNTKLEGELSNTIVADATKLAEAESNRTVTLARLQEAQAEAKAAKDAVAKAATEIADREKRIAELQRTNTDLDTEALTLTREVSTLNAQIKETQKQLEGSQGENKLLADELKQLEAQKEDLERRLSDIAALKAQVRTLQDNLSTARRITWLGSGVYNSIGQKGGQILITPPKPTPSNTNKSPLNVELHQGGGFNIITNPPSTNAPSTNPPSAAPSGP